MINRRTLSAACAVAVCASPASAEIIFTVAPGGPSGLSTHIVYAPGPLAVAGGAASGLVAADEINSFSQPEGVAAFLLCISVDPGSVGAVPPCPDLPPFNVMDQATKGQAAGDAFISKLAFDREGVLPGAAGLEPFNNVLAINQAPFYSGGDFRILPAAGPGEFVMKSIDDVDGGGSALIGAPLILYYTFDFGSPKLAGGSAADVWFDPSADRLSGAGGDETIFATAADLGLIGGPGGDAIASLAVFDDDLDGTWSGTDQILFSLEPGSPTLALLGASPGDILSIGFGEAPVVFATAEMLGLLPGDQVDMLELVPLAGTALETIVDKLHLCTQDVNGDCQINVQDLVEVIVNWGGHDAGDVNFDGLVDVQDLVDVVVRWGECPEPCNTFDCPGQGDCFVPHLTPGCDDFDCCKSVCEVDSFCCDVEWDQFCVNQAAQLCASACVGAVGSCLLPHGSPGCADPVCCEIVCAVDLFCCEIQWDQICADEAASLCVGCDAACLPGDILEGEPCGADTDGGCNSTPPSFAQGYCGPHHCGTAWAQGGIRDTDWYLVQTGPGMLGATLQSEFPGVVFIVDVAGGSCANIAVIGMIGSSSNCVPGMALAPVAPGNYAIFVATGNPNGSGIFDGFPCGGGNNEYRLLIQCPP